MHTDQPESRLPLQKFYCSLVGVGEGTYAYLSLSWQIKTKQNRKNDRTIIASCDNFLCYEEY